VSELLVRPAREDELPAVLGLLAEDVIRERAEPAEVTDRQRRAFAELLADPGELLLVGELDGRVVATAQLSWLRVLAYDGGLYCQVESVRVASGHRGRRLGEQLMDHVVGLARERGCARVQLTTNARREGARRFYARLGFVESHIGMKLFLGTSEENA
jgi:ribosomal protein S18 acetylase RimI-like enzyme